MNVNISVDYDSVIDDILLSENHTAEKNYFEGTEKASENSYQQGFEIGFKKAYDIGLEIGFYDGILIAINKLQKLKIIILSDREHNILQKLLNLIEAFPHSNDTNVNIVDKYNEVKGLYRKFCINFKIKDLDKSVLNFSKWSN